MLSTPSFFLQTLVEGYAAGPGDDRQGRHVLVLCGSAEMSLLLARHCSAPSTPLCPSPTGSGVGCPPCAFRAPWTCPVRAVATCAVISQSVHLHLSLDFQLLEAMGTPLTIAVAEAGPEQVFGVGLPND